MVTRYTPDTKVAPPATERGSSGSTRTGSGKSSVCTARTARGAADFGGLATMAQPAEERARRHHRPLPRAKAAAAHVLGFLHGHEGGVVPGVDDLHAVVEVAALHGGEEHLDAAFPAVACDLGHAVAPVAECLGDLHAAMGRDDAHHRDAIR